MVRMKGPIASRRSGPLGEPIDPQAAVARDGGDPLAVGEQADRVDCRSADVELAAPVWSRAVGEQEPRLRAGLIREHHETRVANPGDGLCRGSVLTAVENGGAGRSKMVALGGVDLP